MKEERLDQEFSEAFHLDLTDQDVLAAMKSIPGYLDITPADFREVYLQAFQKAIERLSRSLKARDIMTQEVIRVKPEATIIEVAERMAQKGVSGVPVVDEDNRVLGIISEKNFMNLLSDGTAPNVMGVIARCLQGNKCLAAPLRGQRAQDIMSFPVISLRADSTLAEISRLFSVKYINRAPVLDSQGQLLGIVSRGDIVKANRWLLK